MDSIDTRKRSIDYSAIDRPEVLQFMFYPRVDWVPPPAGALDYSIPVGEDVSISCRFFICSKDSPSILYFHGNGEVVSDYNWTAPLYSQEGINLFVADYRGYGSSTGFPTFSDMIGDAHTVFHSFRQILSSDGYSSNQFVMGRSLGSHSAVEIASHYQSHVQGLILESGFAGISRLVERLSHVEDFSRLKDIETAHLEKIRSISLPVLIIHGDCDELVPPIHATHFYDTVGAEDKRLVTIQGAGHNDIMMIGREQYFSAIREFVFGAR
jgi:alpha-beta hydrolase superfamily lysophospholipase